MTKEHKVIWLAVGVPILGLLLLFGVWWLILHYPWGYAEFRREVKKTISPYELQAWAKAMLAEDPAPGEIPRERMPLPLRHIEDGHLAPCRVEWTDTKRRAVQITCRGQFRGYGMIIGDESLVLSESDPGGSYEQWIPGVYFELFKTIY